MRYDVFPYYLEIPMTSRCALIALALLGLVSGCSSSSKSGGGAEEGFVSLFNGKDLTGWTGGTEDYSVKDGVITFKKGGHGNLLTEKEYKDFDLRLEFKLEPEANNGVTLRAPLEAKASMAYKAMEIQILDDTGYKAKHPLQDYQHCGSIYGCVAAKQGHVKAPGEWQEMRIVAKGPELKIYLNGTLITEGNLAELASKPTLDHKDHPGLKNEKGRVGFLGHNDVVQFRNIRIKEL
jgi:hypothetical protein